MALYEHIFIVRQDVSSQQIDELTEQFKSFIEQGKGSVTKVEHWGLRTLAYRIKKNRKGHYIMFNLDAPHEAVAEMERNQRLNEDIIRTLTIKVEELEEGPSAMKRGREERDFKGRGGRDDRGPRGRDRDRDRGAPIAKPAAAPAPAVAATAETPAVKAETSNETKAGDEA